TDDKKEGEEEVNRKDGSEAAVVPPQIEIELDGIQSRLREVPIAPGAYHSLRVGQKSLFWVAEDSGKQQLMGVEAMNIDVKPEKLVQDIRNFDLSLNRKKILVRKEDSFYVIDAKVQAPGKLADKQIDIGNVAFPINVREDWRQIFIDAWRMERDYFYDPNMHGVDWTAVRDKYL
ncbi:MAG: S41 family peptidase, partial [bacterium]